MFHEYVAIAFNPETHSRKKYRAGSLEDLRAKVEEWKMRYAPQGYRVFGEHNAVEEEKERG